MSHLHLGAYHQLLYFLTPYLGNRMEYLRDVLGVDAHEAKKLISQQV